MRELGFSLTSYDRFGYEIKSKSISNLKNPIENKDLLASIL